MKRPDLRSGVSRKDLPIATKLIAAAAAALALALLAGCTGGGGGGGALSGGLTARMDQPGASLNRGEALGIINHYRATLGVGALVNDSGLDATAQQLATDYARTGRLPKVPAGAVALRVSAGYANFAETFSGWRNSPPDAQALATRTARAAGIGVHYDASSSYGIYWVLLLDD
jgi:hypothetical protein